MSNVNYEAAIEAILFTMGNSVELEQIADALELDKKKTKKIIENMMEQYKDDNRGMAEKRRI